MRIKDVMVVDVEAVEQGASLDEAAYIMRSAGVGSLPVVEEERLVGVITARDIVERAVAEGLNLTETKVRDIMTIEVVSCAESGNAEEAVLLMTQHRVRQIFIVDEQGDLSGIIAAADIAALAAAPVENGLGERRGPLRRPWTIGSVLGAVALLVAGCVAPVKSARGDTAGDAAGRLFLVEAVVDNWWPVSALSARRLIAEYGVPDEVRPEKIVWYGNGPWKRTVVRDVPQSFGPQTDLGVVEQTLERDLTQTQIRDLSGFDRGVRFDLGARELTAKSDSEENNFLRLNLADDIVNRRMTSEEARALHARVHALKRAGKSSPYLLGLGFPRGPLLRRVLNAPAGEQAEGQSDQGDD